LTSGRTGNQKRGKTLKRKRLQGEGRRTQKIRTRGKLTRTSLAVSSGVVQKRRGLATATLHLMGEKNFSGTRGEASQSLHTTIGRRYSRGTSSQSREIWTYKGIRQGRRDFWKHHAQKLEEEKRQKFKPFQQAYLVEERRISERDFSGMSRSKKNHVMPRGRSEAGGLQNSGRSAARSLPSEFRSVRRKMEEKKNSICEQRQKNVRNPTWSRKPINPRNQRECKLRDRGEVQQPAERGNNVKERNEKGPTRLRQTSLRKPTTTLSNCKPMNST